MNDLEKRGYKVNDSTPLVTIEKPITERAKVVISPIEECSFIWLTDEDAEDKDNEGVRALGPSIIVKEESESRIFEDGATKPVIFKRYATFGSSTPDRTYQWADFKRFDNLIENAIKNADFEKRIKALETKKSPVPIGLIAIWGKPANVPIPEGWKECTDLRGRFPLGWNPDDEDFDKLGKEGGEKEHTLTVDEMPRHSHGYTDTYKMGNQGQRGPGGYNGLYNSTYNSTTSETGKGQPHNNMPPYRIIKFIEFIGFND